jgi:hypothetical protein
LVDPFGRRRAGFGQQLVAQWRTFADGPSIFTISVIFTRKWRSYSYIYCIRIRFTRKWRSYSYIYCIRIRINTALAPGPFGAGRPRGLGPRGGASVCATV